MTTTPQEAVAALGLSIRAEFVPFSKSRNAAETDERGRARHSLNWKVTLVRVPAGGAQMHGAPLNTSAPARDILTTDYGAGIAHCPSYKRPAPSNWGRPARDWQALACAWECEHGVRASYFMHAFSAGTPRKPIMPSELDVIHSLVMDSDVLDSGGFDDWASSLGYDTDSRKAESIYRACLEIALKLRAGIGESGLAALRDAFSEY